MYRVPFNKQIIVGNEIEYLKDTLKNGAGGGRGKYTLRCEKFIEEKFGVKKAFLTPSCTHALEIIALLIDTSPGDEFIMPSFTYVSTANVFVKHGGVPVFVDIREDTLNVDERKIEEAITNKTKAIVVVHYAGVGADMDEIMKIARKHNLIVVEDAAQGVNARYKGIYLGSFGDLGCYSFHETKNYSMGEGGALLINNPKYIKRAEIIRDRGTNKGDFLEGIVESYVWVDLGAGYYPSDLNAAVLWARFEKLDYIQKEREKIWWRYFKSLTDLEKEGFVRLPRIPENVEPNWHIFYILLENENVRENLRKFLLKNGIQATFHYIPLHESPFYKKRFGDVKLEITEKVARTILRLPIHLGISESDIDYVLGKIREFFKRS